MVYKLLVHLCNQITNAIDANCIYLIYIISEINRLIITSVEIKFSEPKSNLRSDTNHNW